MAKVAQLDHTRNWTKQEPFAAMDDAAFANEIRQATEYMSLIAAEATRRGIQIKHEPDGVKIQKTETL